MGGAGDTFHIECLGHAGHILCEGQIISCDCDHNVTTLFREEANCLLGRCAIRGLHRATIVPDKQGLVACSHLCLTSGLFPPQLF